MSTPNSNFINNKNSPSWNGINKSLLTPCRTVGLSRKRKTPLSSLSKHASDDLYTSSGSVTSISCCPEKFENETTPVTHKALNKKKKGDNLLVSQTAIPPVVSVSTLYSDKKEPEVKNRESKSKKALLPSFTADELSESHEKLPIVKKIKITEDDENVSKEVKTNTEQICPKDLTDSRNDNKNVKLKRKRAAKRLDSSDFEDLTKEVDEIVAISDDSDDDFMMSRHSRTKREKLKAVKPVKKTSLLRSSSCKTDDSVKSDNSVDSVKKCKIQLQKLSEDEVCFAPSNNSQEENLFNKKSSSFTMDDTEFFTSTPEEDREKRKKLERKIRDTESRIKQKQLTLESLERAEIYKSKHNIQELKQLTEMWLNGCVQALKDLIPLLQAHGPVDINRVLNNMGIPKEIVMKLPLEVGDGYI